MARWRIWVAAALLTLGPGVGTASAERLRPAYGFSWPWWVTHPRFPACYGRPPYVCPARPARIVIPVESLDLDGLPTHLEMPAPRYHGRVVRHRAAFHRRVRPAVRVRG